MILSVGEILADMFGENKNGKLTLDCNIGGAPFNLAVNAKKAGGTVAFLGRVGNDNVGAYLKEQAEKANLDYLYIQTDNERSTTLAFVTLKDGERDFSFMRNGTADFNIDEKEFSFDHCAKLNIVHIGSLMLSEKKGKKVASHFLKKSKELGIAVSFDLNFRKDIFKDIKQARKVYKKYVEGADIVKFSEDEVLDYTGMDNFDEAVQSLLRPNKLILVTKGAEGSAYYYNGKSGVVPTQPVTPIDTTGAGDAFFGTFLARIDGKPLSKETIETALVYANNQGAITTQFKGAIKL